MGDDDHTRSGFHGFYCLLDQWFGRTGDTNIRYPPVRALRDGPGPQDYRVWPSRTQYWIKNDPEVISMSLPAELAGPVNVPAKLPEAFVTVRVKPGAGV